MYSERDISPVREDYPGFFRQYFESYNEGEWRIDRELRKKVVFREFNLKQDRSLFQETFDLIICRNVFIYFDRNVIQKVVTNLSQALGDGGYLFIGHTETLNEIDHDLQRIKTSIYRKKA